MFQLYSQNINPDSEHFLTFITKHLEMENVTNPTAVPYPELYKLIKDGIREYLHQQETSGSPNKLDAKCR